MFELKNHFLSLFLVNGVTEHHLGCKKFGLTIPMFEALISIRVVITNDFIDSFQ